jgi:hypothetical protein
MTKTSKIASPRGEDATSENLPILIEPTTLKKKQTHKLKDEIEDKFIEYLFLYRDPREAALKAGYSKSTSDNVKYTKLKDPRFLSKVRKAYNGNVTLKLPDIFQSEANSIEKSNEMANKIFDYINENELSIEKEIELIEKAMGILGKAAPTRREGKQSAGVLANDTQTTPNIINVGQIQAVFHKNQVEISGNEADN